jgi:signal peptidase
MSSKRIIKRSGNILLVLSVTITLFVLASHYFFGFNFITVYGNSMSPTIPQGALMITHTVAPSEIAIDDIIAFRPPGGATTTVAHRVVEVNPAENTVLFITKGDAVEDNDSYAVPATNVLGRVIFWIPLVGYITHSIKTVPGFVLLVLVPMVLIILLQARSLIRAHSTKSDK